MDLATVSLLAIVIAIVIGFWRDINVGILSMGFAFLLGVWGAGFSAGEIIAFWPTKLFVTLIGVSLLFSMARCNGTLERLARRSVALANGNGPLIPWIFFGLAALFAAIGPGNIAVVAILGPIGMAIAQEMHISPILMATLLIGGSNAGGMSPIAPTGIIGVNLSQQYLHVDTTFTTWLAMVLSAFIWCGVVYLAYGGYKLPKKPLENQKENIALNASHRWTVAGMTVLILVVAFLKWDLGLSAFAISGILLALRVAEEKQALSGIPWGAMILVAGTGTLIEVTAHLGGIDLLTSFFRGFMNEQTAPAVMGVISSIMTFFASASGVVMPTLIRTLPGLLQDVQPISAPIMVAAIVAGGHLVTTGPFTTLGALASASLTPEQDRNQFIRQQLITAIASTFFGFVLFLGLFQLPWFS